jgi:hypothetical protein
LGKTATPARTARRTARRANISPLINVFPQFPIAEMQRFVLTNYNRS